MGNPIKMKTHFIVLLCFLKKPKFSLETHAEKPLLYCFRYDLNSFVHRLFNIPLNNKPAPTSSFIVNIFQGLVSELEIVVIWKVGDFSASSLMTISLSHFLHPVCSFPPTSETGAPLIIATDD